MTQKNILKILVIMIAVLSLFAVSCRKASTSPEPTPTPTPSNPTDPIRSLTGNLLIVSADGTKGANSLPLSFVGASATVSDVKVEQFGGQGGDILLFPTNFIIENGNLYLTNLEKTNAQGNPIEAGKTNSKVTLTFSLSGENLSRYTDTEDIFVGKMQTNIGTNDFVSKLNNNITSDKGLFANANVSKAIGFAFNYELSKDSNNYLVFTNSRDGQSENYIDFGHTLTYSNFYSNFNKIINENWQSFGDSYLIEQTIEDKTNGIVKLKFEPASFYEPYIFKFIMTNGEFVLTNASK